MNDELNLYLLIRFEMDPRFPSWISTMFFFDDEHTGEVDQGDDALLLAPDFVGFEDIFANIEPPCPSGQICYTRDVLAGGTDDGAPGPRQATMVVYYAAFIRDPDGNKIEVMTVPSRDQMTGIGDQKTASRSASLP